MATLTKNDVMKEFLRYLKQELVIAEEEYDIPYQNEEMYIFIDAKINTLEDAISELEKRIEDK